MKNLLSRRTVALLIVFMLVANLIAFDGFAYGDATVSADLNNFISNLTVDGITEENGAFTVIPGAEYGISMVFQENLNYQFDNDRVLTYQMPQGLNAVELPEQNFTVTITDDEGAFTIEDNTYRVEDGKLYVQFSKNDLAKFNRLAAVANLNFEVNINAEFDNSYTEIDFGNSVIKSFNYDLTKKLEIEKFAHYHKNFGKVNYSLVVKCTAI